VSVAVVAAAGGQPRVISAPPPAEFPAARHVVPETVVLTAADGKQSHAIVFLPTDLRAGEKRPALLYIHGGGGRFVLGYPDQNNGFYHYSYAVIQYYVNKGYIVAAVNYRGGSALYGTAFRNPDEYSQNGVSEYRDVLAAGLWLRDRPDVDPERLGVWGLSYGGWLTGQALSRNSDIFKAGMIFAGVQLRSTSLDEDNLAYQSSPAYNIEKWTSPTLIVHGDDDRNVEFSQTIGIINLFRAHAVPHELIVYPDDTHYFGFYNRWIRAFTATDDFFDRTLIRKEGVRVTGRREGA
jgi:dipeptidyl aminopeptidase/acylaminoacyl peptidase